MEMRPNKVARHLRRIAAGLLLLAGPGGPLWAQPAISSEQVSFEARTLRGAGAKIDGELRLPETGAGVHQVPRHPGFTGLKLAKHWHLLAQQ
jgi:hypothetical protein